MRETESGMGWWWVFLIVGVSIRLVFGIGVVVMEIGEGIVCGIIFVLDVFFDCRGKYVGDIFVKGNVWIVVCVEMGFIFLL